MDGAGLCSPGRWDPERRLLDPIAKKMRGALLAALVDHFRDLPRLAFELASGRFKASPFEDKLLAKGRQRLNGILVKRGWW